MQRQRCELCDEWQRSATAFDPGASALRIRTLADRSGEFTASLRRLGRPDPAPAGWTTTSAEEQAIMRRPWSIRAVAPAGGLRNVQRRELRALDVDPTTPPMRAVRPARRGGGGPRRLRAAAPVQQSRQSTEGEQHAGAVERFCNSVETTRRIQLPARPGTDLFHRHHCSSTEHITKRPCQLTRR